MIQVFQKCLNENRRGQLPRQARDKHNWHEKARRNGENHHHSV